MHVIHNGLDTSQFKLLSNDFKECYGIQNKTVVLSNVVEWNENKGILDCLKWADLLGTKY